MLERAVAARLRQQRLAAGLIRAGGERVDVEVPSHRPERGDRVAVVELTLGFAFGVHGGPLVGGDVRVDLPGGTDHALPRLAQPRGDLAGGREVRQVLAALGGAVERPLAEVLAEGEAELVGEHVAHTAQEVLSRVAGLEAAGAAARPRPGTGGAVCLHADRRT